MIFKLIERKECSIKKVLDENAHYVIFNDCEYVCFSDYKLYQELVDLGITDKMLRDIMGIMDSNCYDLPNEINPVYHCGTLYPYYNITFTYPFFQGPCLQYYMDDIIKATEMMKTNTIYFSHHSISSRNSIIKILSQKNIDQNLTIYFIT